jgi:8-oxo-dGTP diphosphatase
METSLIEIKFRVAVKALIVHDKKMLVVKRAEDDVQKPGIWELPGGRLELGEDPILGIIREIREETGLYIKPSVPMSVRHFVRDDKQVVTMLVFFCRVMGGEMKISEEHSSFDWVDLKDCKEKINPFFHKEVDILYKLNLHNLIEI